MARARTLLALGLLSLTLAGCDLIGDLLEFGFWAIVIIALIIVLLVWLIASALRGRTRDRRPPA